VLLLELLLELLVDGFPPQPASATPAIPAPAAAPAASV
jgi:hypothetical protein